MFKYKNSKVYYKKYIKWVLDYFRHLVKNYLRHSSLHGCHYIVDHKEHGIFSVAWAIILFTSLLFCVFLMCIQLKRFQETAVLNSIASTGFPIWKIPFPAVIICNNNIVYKSKSDNVKAMLMSKEFQEKEIDRFFEHLSSLVVCQNCEERKELYNNTADINIYSYLKDLNYNINTLMMELAHPCEKMIKKCHWKSDEKNCGQLFRRIKTTLGYCCAFNYFGTFDAQYDGYESRVHYSGGFGLGSGLEVVVDIEPSEYVSSIKTTVGIELLVGDMFQFAEMGLYSHSVAGGQDLNVGLYPTVYGAHEDLKYISDASRGCWFSNEGSQRWSKIYNTLTCFNECKAAFIYETCSCIPFYYSFTGARRVCTPKDLSCILRNENKFVQVMMTNDIEEDSKYMEEKGISNTRLCYCLPSCEETQYEIYKNIEEVKLSNSTSTINIHFNSITATYMIRNVHVTWDTLLATIGGIFGLCMGGSILSVVELVFFTLNACLKVKHQRNIRKKVDAQMRNVKFISKMYPSVDVKRQFLN